MCARETKKVSIVVFSDELDKVCAALTIANVAAASDREVAMFFTCWGVNIVRKGERRLAGDDFLSRIINLLSPGGPERLHLSRFNFFGLGSWLMRKRIKAKKIQSIPEMIVSARELGVNFFVCENPIDIMGLKREDMIDEVDDIVGAASYINQTSGAEITLFI